MKRLIAPSAVAAALILASATPAWAPVVIDFKGNGNVNVFVDNPDYRTQVAVEATVGLSVDSR